MIRIMKLVLFLTFVVALAFVIDASPMAQADGGDTDPAIASFKHCRKLCHSLQTFVSYFSKRFKDGKGYVACMATCEQQLEKYCKSTVRDIRIYILFSYYLTSIFVYCPKNYTNSR